jgi:hypothetical protein
LGAPQAFTSITLAVTVPDAPAVAMTAANCGQRAWSAAASTSSACLSA